MITGRFREAVKVVTSLTIGERANVPSDRLQLMRVAAWEHGIKLSLIERRTDGVAVIERVDKTRWGVIKAHIAKMEIGDSITAPVAQRESYRSAARGMKIFLRAVRVTSTILLFTRVEKAVRAHYGEIKQAVADLPVGCALADQEPRRAKNLCTAGCHLGFGMSRRRQPDGNYTVSRLA